jgi:outer membrane protein OmpA-like peptidoglycan-associated protein
MYSKIILLTLYILPLPLLATPCKQATQLVTQAYDLGHSAYAQKKQQLQRALSLCPNHADAHNNLAVVLENEQHYTQALQHYQRALQIDPDYYKAWIGIGDIYYKQGQYPLSLEAYLQACTRDEYARQRITALFDKNRYRTAENGNILEKESLSLLYDKARLKKLHDMVEECRSRYPMTIDTDSLLDTFAVFRNLHFELGKSILNTQVKRQLDDIANSLLERDSKKSITIIIISGHTDIKPFQGLSHEESELPKWKLSLDRATAISTALVKRGLEKKMIETRGYGYTEPATGYSIADWDKNRRVEIEVHFEPLCVYKSDSLRVSR